MPSIYNSRDELLNLFPDNNQQLIEAKDIRAFINAIYDESVIKGEDVIDNLSTVSVELPLSASQGRILNINKEDSLGNPSQSGFILSSDIYGNRFWIKQLRLLGDLDDVDVSTVQDGNYLVFDGNSKRWVPSSISSSGFIEKGGRIWKSYKNYLQGDIITYRDEVYFAKVDIGNNYPPDTYPGGWKKLNNIDSLDDLIDVKLSFPVEDDNVLISENSIFKPTNLDKKLSDKIQENLIEGTGIDVELLASTGETKISLNATLNDLQDVNTTSNSPSFGNILYFNGNEWIPSGVLDQTDKGGNKWANNVLYIQGTIISYGTNMYIALRTNTNETPGASTAWELVSFESLPDTDLSEANSGDMIMYDFSAQKWQKISTTFTGDFINRGKIPRLNDSGKLDPSMLDVTTFHRIDSWDPTIEEYPDTSGHLLGAFWDILFTDGTTLEYTYTSGDLVGKTVKQGDFIIWGIGGWTIMPAVMNPLHYYKRDGSQPITADFEAGGYKLKDVKAGTNLTDAVNVDQLSSKEDYLGTPTANDMMLTSDLNDNRTWIPVPDTGVKDHDQLNNLDLADQHPIKTIIGLQDDLDLRYYKTDFINTSVGGQDAGKPIILDSNGKIDSSMLAIESLHYVGPWTPSSSNEYPDPSGESFGAFWVIEGLSLPYTFLGGDLVGQTIENGDYMIWSEGDGSGQWQKMESSIDPGMYYLLDGSKAITGPFAGGNQQIKNIAQGTENSDAINLFQHNQHTTNTTNPHQVTKAQIGLGNVENYSPEDLPISDDTQSALDSKEDWLGNPNASGLVLSSDTTGNRTWIEMANAAVWGNITGNIDNQTDLRAELDTKVNKSGDTMTGELHVENTIKADKIFIQNVNNKSILSFQNIAGGNLEPSIYWDSLVRKYKVTTNDSTNIWDLWHSGNFDPNLKINKLGDTMTGRLKLSLSPLYDNDAVDKKYVDDIINTDVMLKSVYDTNSNGVVDKAEDSERLGTHLPDYFATDIELQEKVSKSGDTITGDLDIQGSLVVETKTDLYDAELRKTLIKSYSDSAKITFEDTVYTSANPGIWWDSTDQNMKIEIETGNSYNIWHSGNFNPDTLNPMVRKTIIGDGTTTEFSIPEGYTPNNADVYYNGVRLFEPEDVDISSGNKIVFTEAPELDDRIDFCGYKNSLL